MLRLEVGHQFVQSGGVYYHDIGVLFGINPAAMVALVIEPFRKVNNFLRGN